jgi:hypothetical protein
MDAEKGLGWGIVAIGGALGVYLAYNLFRNQKGGLFSGLAATLFGQDVASGKVGENLANDVWGWNPTGGGIIWNENGIPYNADATKWDARYAQGYEPLWAKVYNVPTVNVPVTDQAFAKIGLTTAQVERIQMKYPQDVIGLVVALKTGQELTARQRKILVEVRGF